MKTLRYYNGHGDEELIMRNQLVRFSKCYNTNYTVIHLLNGEIIYTTSSIGMLESQLNN